MKESIDMRRLARPWYLSGLYLQKWIFFELTNKVREKVVSLQTER